MANKKPLLISLILPNDLPSLNKWQGWHWAQKNRFKKKLAHDLRYLFLCEANIGELNKHIKRSQVKPQITMKRFYDGYRVKLYDHDNFVGGCSKPLMDAFQRIGFLPDDSQKWMVHGEHIQKKDSLNPRFEVEILIPDVAS